MYRILNRDVCIRLYRHFSILVLRVKLFRAQTEAPSSSALQLILQASRLTPLVLGEREARAEQPHATHELFDVDHPICAPLGLHLVDDRFTRYLW